MFEIVGCRAVDAAEPGREATRGVAKNLSAGNALGLFRGSLSLIVLCDRARWFCQCLPNARRDFLRSPDQIIIAAAVATGNACMRRDNFQMALSALISAHVIQA